MTRSLDGVASLLARLTLGVTFAGTGWGKLQHLDKVTAFFTELNRTYLENRNFSSSGSSSSLTQRRSAIA